VAPARPAVQGHPGTAHAAAPVDPLAQAIPLAQAKPTAAAVPPHPAPLAPLAPLAVATGHADATAKAGGLHLLPLTRAVAPRPAAQRSADGWETWRFLPDKRLSRYYPTGTWTVAATAHGKDDRTVTEYATFRFRRATRLSPVRVEKAGAGAGGAVRVRGSLTRVDPRGLTDYGPFGRQRLEILWRQDWHSDWQQVAETVTDAAGGFETRIYGRPNGYWRVRFPGTAHYAAYTSRSRRTMR
jgi:hypothetical protein